MNDDNEMILSFEVHTNFKNSGLVFGFIKLRNLIEASISCIPLATIIYFIFKTNIKTMLVLEFFIVIPLLCLNLVGVNNNTFFEFLKIYFSFRKKKKGYLMRYRRIEKLKPPTKKKLSRR